MALKHIHSSDVLIPEAVSDTHPGEWFSGFYSLAFYFDGGTRILRLHKGMSSEEIAKRLDEFKTTLEGV